MVTQETEVHPQTQKLGPPFTTHNNIHIQIAELAYIPHLSLYTARETADLPTSPCQDFFSGFFFSQMIISEHTERPPFKEEAFNMKKSNETIENR